MSAVMDNVLIDDVCSAWNIAKDDKQPLRLRLKNYRTAKSLFDLADEHSQPELMRRCGINRTHVDNIGRLLYADVRRVRNMIVFLVVLVLLFLGARFG